MRMDFAWKQCRRLMSGNNSRYQLYLKIACLQKKAIPLENSFALVLELCCERKAFTLGELFEPSASI
jgi:hypothetical protein